MTNKEPKEIKCRDCGKMETGAHACRRISKDNCYCVCHSPYSSRAWCEHCKGDNEVGKANVAKNLKSSPTWEEKERKEFYKSFGTICCVTPGNEFYSDRLTNPNRTDIADYWIERIRAAREEGYESRGSLHQKLLNTARNFGRSAALKEVIPKILKLKDCYAIAYDEEINNLVATLSALIDQK